MIGSRSPKTAAAGTAPEAITVLHQQGVIPHIERQTVSDSFRNLRISLSWQTEPGSIDYISAYPTLWLPLDEVGGRCEFRSTTGRGVEGEFLGSGHISAVPSGTPIRIHAADMRHVLMLCCVLGPGGDRTDVTFDEHETGIAAAPLRLMFRDEMLRSLAGLLGSLEGDEADAYERSLFQAIKHAWHIALNKKSSKPSPIEANTLATILSYLRNTAEESVKLADLSSMAGMTPSAFGRAFRELTGLSPQAWQLETKIKNAQRLMWDNPGGSLAEVARLCRFADQSHLSRSFLKSVDQSPTDWLRSRF